MKLDNYLSEYKITNNDLAKRVGVHFSTISYIRSGKRRPSPDLALKIEQETDGKVTIRDLFYS